uniref:UspA domain-containing protein n=1 Tax=Davidia involucrata TaxID=16924 RepID=A0A5B7B4V4_DAVIN
MMWALTHVTNKGDLLTLLHIIPPHKGSERTPDSSSSSPYLASSLGSLCKACKPEVEVEALVIQGPKLATVMSQVKKLEVSVLVLGQKQSSPLINCRVQLKFSIMQFPLLITNLMILISLTIS